MGSLIQLAVLFAIPALVASSCFMGGLPYTNHEGDKYCVYKPHQNKYWYRVVESGRKFRDWRNCLKCTCSDFGLSCCGYGRFAGYIAVPSNCEKVPRGRCGYRIVCHPIPDFPETEADGNI